MSEWKPIETAPRDGTMFDVWVEYRGLTRNDSPRYWRLTNVCWVADHGKWEMPSGFGREAITSPEVRLTHWMPLPKPPPPEPHE